MARARESIAGGSPTWPAGTPGEAGWPAASEVHLWFADLDVAEGVARRLASHLEPAEAARARRFRDALDAHRWIAARGLLREILAAYLDADPCSIRLSYGPLDKPALASGRSDLRFNLAHCEDRLLVGVSAVRELGVDLERRRDIPDAVALARLALSASEREALEALPAEARSAAFLDAWTRREALAKATGEGLAAVLGRLEARLDTDAESADGEPGAGWSLRRLEPAPDFVGALAVRGPLDEPRGWCLDADASRQPR